MIIVPHTKLISKAYKQEDDDVLIEVMIAADSLEQSRSMCVSMSCFVVVWLC
jgi:hypothetical protein